MARVCFKMRDQAAGESCQWRDCFQLSASAMKEIIEALVKKHPNELGECVLISVEVDIKSYVVVGTVNMDKVPQEPADGTH